MAWIRLSKRTTWLWAGVLLALVAGGGFLAWKDWVHDLQWAHVKKALLEVEYGTSVYRTARWQDDVITIGLSAKYERQRRQLEGVVAELNGVLAGIGPRLELNGREEDEKLYVFFVPMAEMEATARKMDIPYVPNNMGYFEYTTGNDDVIDIAAVLIAEELRGDELKMFLLEEIFQALGPAQDTPYFPTSVIYQTETENSGATELSIIDRKLLRFLYHHLKPGDDEAAVRRAFDAHWASVTAD